MSDVLSQRTKSDVASALVLNQNEIYPDRTLLAASENAIKVDTTTGLLRLDFNRVPRTTSDMSKLYKWKKGAPKLYGTHATREEKGMNQYIKDIEGAPTEADYYDGNIIFIDTLKEIGPQLKKFQK